MLSVDSQGPIHIRDSEIHKMPRVHTVLRGTHSWVDLHGEEEPEVGVWCQGVESLLHLDQPLWGQVDILQHHPATTKSAQKPAHTSFNTTIAASDLVLQDCKYTG